MDVKQNSQPLKDLQTFDPFYATEIELDCRSSRLRYVTQLLGTSCTIMMGTRGPQKLGRTEELKARGK
jgi:hypothetical protein